MKPCPIFLSLLLLTACTSQPVTNSAPTNPTNPTTPTNPPIPAADPPERLEPLTITAIEECTFVAINTQGAPWFDYEYSTDSDPDTWIAMTPGNAVEIRYEGESMHIRAHSDRDMAQDWDNYIQLRITDGRAAVSGNIMSLVTTTLNDSIIERPLEFYRLFEGCGRLKFANLLKLPAQTLTANCYRNMFNGSGLRTAPILPATTLVEGCYYEMFGSCDNLESVTCLADDISAQDCIQHFIMENTILYGHASAGWDNVVNTNLKSDAYELFAITALADSVIVYADNCGTGYEYTYDNVLWTPLEGLVELNHADDIVYIRAKTDRGYIGPGNYLHFQFSDSVAVRGNIMYLTSPSPKSDVIEYEYEFSGLFEENSYLVDVADLQLPARTLKEGCYERMFNGCPNITVAPVLPARVLVDECYKEMFTNCTKLRQLACLASENGARDCTKDWVIGANEGVFIALFTYLWEYTFDGHGQLSLVWLGSDWDY